MPRDLLVCADSADTKPVATQDFDAIWAPRIGKEAAGYLPTYFRAFFVSTHSFGSAADGDR